MNREHIVHDLQPYQCTYPHCKDEDILYPSRASWIAHEAQAHRRVWRCFEHTDLFTSASALRAHLTTEHNNLGDFQIQAIEDLGQASTKDERSSCPFCLSGPICQRLVQSHGISHGKIGKLRNPKKRRVYRRRLFHWEQLKRCKGLSICKEFTL